MMKSDIQTPDDIKLLVDQFYAQAIKDELIGHFFTDVMQMKLEEHLPRIYDFWESILLHTSSYRGNVMLKHIELDRLATISDEQIDRWLFLWTKSVDSRYTGDCADEAKRRASLMAELMKFKLKQRRGAGFIQ